MSQATAAELLEGIRASDPLAAEIRQFKTRAAADRKSRTKARSRRSVSRSVSRPANSGAAQPTQRVDATATTAAAAVAVVACGGAYRCDELASALYARVCETLALGAFRVCSTLVPLSELLRVGSRRYRGFALDDPLRGFFFKATRRGTRRLTLQNHCSLPNHGD